MGNTSKWIFLLKKIPMLLFGLFLYSAGIVATLYSRLGMSPWEVFHMGIVNHTPLTLGQTSQITGFCILALSYFIGVIPGLASILNMFFIGFFIDFINNLGFYRVPTTLLGRFSLLVLGILMIGWATYFYLKVQLGAGPRDGLMEGLVKKLKKPVWIIRSAIEITVLIIGYFLGGPVGIGTLVTAFTIGFSVQLAFKIGKYDSKSAEHEDILKMINNFKKKQEENIG
ncbi:MAG: membrane protein [Lutispora sp.]|nr:membrane protein [Lutispora sp.]MDD4834935.1 membrane protein [Lutispora sp.]